MLESELPRAARDRVVELDQTPFFPQEAYQCGPAALATVLGETGVEVTPERLAGEVFLPGRRGSLQAELVAASRRHGRVPYRVPPRLDALLAEVRAGRPVLVLQNLGAGPVPVWHYAVVIGYDPADDRVLLRSGSERRKALDAARFLGTWDRAERWGLVALRPDELPAADDPRGFARAVAGLEALGQLEPARRAYAAGAARWPDNAVLRLGLANAHYGLGRLDLAAQGYRAAIALDPQNAAARNNLAHTLLERGCPQAALEVAEAALALPGIPPDLRAALQATRAEIVAAVSPRDDPPHCTSGPSVTPRPAREH